MTKTALCIAWSLVSPYVFETLKYLQALLSYNCDIQVNSEIRLVVHCNLNTGDTSNQE